MKTLWVAPPTVAAARGDRDGRGDEQGEEECGPGSHALFLAHAAGNPAGYAPGVLPLRSTGGSSTPAGEPAGDGGGLHLNLLSTPDDVARARHEVVSFALGSGLDQLEVGAVELAVGEACSNVVRHAYAADASPGRMNIEATADAE